MTDYFFSKQIELTQMKKQVSVIAKMKARMDQN